MKKRFFKVVKIFFIVLGVIFLLVNLLSFLLFVGVAKVNNMDNISFSRKINKLNDMKPIINYVEEYRDTNGKYPDKLGDIKIKKNIDYKYETNNDKNCYTITLKFKKENKTQQYQHCNIETGNSNSSSESFSEYSN